jgi:hypothetical protein
MDTTKLLIFLVIFILLIMFLRAHVTIINTNPVNPVPVPVPAPVNKIGGCAGTRYGCCPNGITARQNAIGTNC